MQKEIPKIGIIEVNKIGSKTLFPFGFMGTLADLYQPMIKISGYLSAIGIIVTIILGTVWFSVIKKLLNKKFLSREINSGEYLKQVANSKIHRSFIISAFGTTILCTFHLLTFFPGNDQKGVLASNIEFLGKIQGSILKIEQSTTEIQKDTTIIKNNTSKLLDKMDKFTEKYEEHAKVIHQEMAFNSYSKDQKVWLNKAALFFTKQLKVIPDKFETYKKLLSALEKDINQLIDQEMGEPQLDENSTSQILEISPAVEKKIEILKNRYSKKLQTVLGDDNYKRYVRFKNDYSNKALQNDRPGAELFISEL